MHDVNIDSSWKTVLADEFTKNYFTELRNKVRIEYKSNVIYPHPTKIFNAFSFSGLFNLSINTESISSSKIVAYSFNKTYF